MALFTAVITRRAWLGDDAYITFRTIDNFINGYGLTWNTIERVQSYTHPLWMLLLSLVYYFTEEIYFSSIIVSILISLTAVSILAFSLASSKLSAIFAVLILTLSNAYVDYSTSGLENPLSHLLLVIFIAVYFKGKTSEKNLFWLSLIASLGITNRMDTALVYLPILVYRAYEIKTWRSLAVLVLGHFPFILWELFSLFYYGFPFPNTSFAKLNTGLTTQTYIAQSQYYFLNLFNNDPLTLVAIAVELLIPVLNQSY